MKAKPIIAGALLITAISGGAYFLTDQDASAAPEPTPTPTATPETTAAPAPIERKIFAGDYNFTVLGSETIPPVHVTECGPDCITIAADSGFKIDLNRQGDKFVGRTTNAAGAVCADNKKSIKADSVYTVDVDGTDGLVKVEGQPCGDGEVVPLAFTLTPVPTI
jgi:hypothetical protein